MTQERHGDAMGDAVGLALHAPPDTRSEPTPHDDGQVLVRPATRRALRRDSVLRRSLALADVLALVGAYLVVVTVLLPSEAMVDPILLTTLPGWVVLHKLMRLYDRDANLIHKSTLNELPAIAQSIAMGVALLFLFGPLAGLELARAETIGFLACALIAVPAARYGARAIVHHRATPERCLLLGSDRVAAIVARKIQAHPEYGVALVGYVDAPDEPSAARPVVDLPLLGAIDDFERVCDEHQIERFVVAFSSLSMERTLDLIRTSKRRHLKLSIVPRLYEVVGSSVEVDQIEGMTLLGLRGPHLTTSTLKLKRTIDMLGAGLGLALLAPVMAGIALAVRVSSPGPVLFAQRRVGRGGHEFHIRKFRTMVHGADAMKPSLIDRNEMHWPMFKMRDDPRVTPVGRLLRRASLDELPQLWNVLRGEMSLVGPRPLVPAESEQVLGWHRARLDLTPGLTGPWQVMGRNAIPFDEMVKLDYLYISEWSLWNDLKLLVRTLPVIAGRRGA
jgi:exopolysaccharide biosynthesis polyprenyl glycosylphosphotransferase